MTKANESSTDESDRCVCHESSTDESNRCVCHESSTDKSDRCICHKSSKDKSDRYVCHESLNDKNGCCFANGCVHCFSYKETPNENNRCFGNEVSVTDCLNSEIGCGYDCRIVSLNRNYN